MNIKGYKIHTKHFEEHDDGDTTHYGGKISVEHPDGKVHHFESHGTDRDSNNVKTQVLDHIKNQGVKLSENEHIHALENMNGKHMKKSNDISKLLELEKKLREAKAMLDKACMEKAEEDKKKKEKNPDEKEDAKLGEEVEHAVERHFEENEDAERKEGHKLQIKKSQVLGSIFGEELEKSNSTTDKAQRIAPGARQPAYVRGVFGEKSKTAQVVDSIVSPEEQVKAQKDKAASNKAKAEAAAAERRAQYRKDGVLKGDDEIEAEVIKFDKNGQWKL